MTLRLFVLLAVAFPVAANDKKPAAAELEGTWKVVSTSFDGKEVSSTGRTLVFGEQAFTAYVGETKGRTLKFTLDPTADPKRIDLDKGGTDGKAFGIYSLEKDVLKICYGEPGADRPKTFESKAGDKIFLLILKRGKD